MIVPAGCGGASEPAFHSLIAPSELTRAPTPDTAIRYDGFYKSDESMSGEHDFIRFYADGTAISAMLSDHWDDKTVSKEFDLGSDHDFKKAATKLEGSVISFKEPGATDDSTAVDFRGTLEADHHLKMEVYSHYRRAHEQATFHFVPLTTN